MECKPPPNPCKAATCDVGAKRCQTTNNTESCSGGTCQGGVCTPTSGCTPDCSGGKNCGTDGCTSDCGSCTGTDTCGGGGTPGVCGTPPVVCTPDNATACQGKNCGNVVNNCDETVSCGTCTGSATCGGGGVSDVCGAPVCTASGGACDGLAFEQNCCSNICQADDYNGVSCPGDIPYCCL